VFARLHRWIAIDIKGDEVRFRHVAFDVEEGVRLVTASRTFGSVEHRPVHRDGLTSGGAERCSHVTL